MEFGIIGAGVIGLSTASELLTQFPSSQVTIYSEKFGEDTTSNGAAGMFRPGGGFHVSGDKTGELSKKWINTSYDHYMSLLQSSESGSLHGVKEVSGYMFSRDKETTKNKLLEDLVPVYRDCTEEELKLCAPHDWEYGSYFTTMVIDASLHLKYLTAKLQDRVRVKRVKVQNFNELSSSTGKNYDFIFNCTGLGSKFLANDNSLVPIRGQVFKVKAPWIKMFYYSDSDTYIIPGIHQVTLGGTRQYDNYSTAIDPHDSAGIWERCTRLVPNLKEGQVIREWAGLRPYRPGGVRSEMEIIKNGSHQLKIIHNYGHGGYGVTFAPGSVKNSVSLMSESHKGIFRLWKSKI